MSAVVAEHRSEMTKLIYSSETSGCGATIELDSQETCLVSVAQSWVFVKSCRGKYRRILLGLFGSVLYNEKDAFKIVMTAGALDSIFPEKRIPITFRNSVLGAFANAIWQCSTAAEVTLTLNEAIARAEKQVKSDAKIVSDYSAFMAKTATKVDCFYDVNVLPHPKEAIIAAIEREIVRSPLEEHVEWLRTGVVFLWNFQEGVGTAPLPSTGVDVAQLPRGAAPADLRELDSELERSFANPNLERDVERAKRFRAIAEIETKQIEERIAAAVRMRKDRDKA